jgi:hypothetical protein
MREVFGKLPAIAMMFESAAGRRNSLSIPKERT